VDPLDATREFTKGDLQCVFCLVGISLLGKPIAGVMHQPFFGKFGRTIWGMVGGRVEGLYPASADPAVISDEDGGRKGGEGVVLTTTASHHSPQIDAAIQRINPSRVIRVGGCGYKATLVMERKADVYLYNTGGCKLWDTCAPHAILSAMGGKITTASGGEIVYAPENVHVPSLVASRINHDKYISLIAGL